MNRRWKRVAYLPAIALAGLALVAVSGLWRDGPQRPAAATDGDVYTAPSDSPPAEAARDAMSAVSAARQLLLEHETGQAAKYLERAERLLDPLERRPAGDRVTLYSRFALPGELAKRQAAERRLRQLAPAVQHGDHDRVIRALRATGLPLVYRYLDLPVPEVSDQVRRALSALRGGDGPRAAAILQHLEQDLRETVVAVNGAATGPTSGPARRAVLQPSPLSDKGAHT